MAEKRAFQPSGAERGLQHHHRMRLHVKVQRVAQPVGGRSRGQRELRHLGAGVHAGVGAAGDDAGHRGAAVQPGCGGLQHRLHGQAGGLPLPADEGRRRRIPASAPRPAPVRPGGEAQDRAWADRMAAQERAASSRRARPVARGSAAGRRRRRRRSGGRPAPCRARHRRLGSRHRRASTFSVAPSSVVKVPGQGSSARTWRAIAAGVAGPVDPAVARASASAA